MGLRRGTTLLAALGLAGGLALVALPAYAEDTGPVLLGTSRTPEWLYGSGGDVTITADATDDVGITMAYAHVFAGDQSMDVQLLPSAVHDTYTTYSGTTMLPPNPTPYDVEWGVEVTVTDTNGAIATGSPGTVVVGGEDQFPEVTDGSVIPGTLPWQGGQIDYSAVLTDDVGVDQAWVTITGSDGWWTGGDLTLGDGDTWSGSASLPPNGTHEDISYQVVVSAVDTAGQQTDTQIGEPTVQGQPQFNEKPVVSQVDVSPTELGADGGLVTIEAQATDTEGSVAYVDAIIRPGGCAVPCADEVDLPMDAVDSDHFSATWTAPASTSTDLETWTVLVRATDDVGQEGEGTGPDVHVAGQQPPAPPMLTVAPKVVRLGDIPVRTRVHGSFVVTNTGDADSLTFVVRDPARPCRLRGADGGDLTLTLDAGESRTVVVSCRPRSEYGFRLVFPVDREDGGQADLRMVVRGRGVRT